MEPIAIIGISCRFPNAKTPEAFWQLLRNGVDAITEIPPERWSIDTFYNSEAATPQKMNTRWSGFLEQVDQFEPSFFGVAPREAQQIDPQQRLLLEVSWEALENAGIIPESLAGSQTGVIIGISSVDYHRLLYKDLSNIEAYSGTGTTLSIAANRLSYLLNLRGPSIALDTACSSSLVAVHLATESLQSRESNLCLVGGVNLILSPEGAITFSQAGMMAADGRCKTFDASADGYVRGEGCGVVVLKRLSDALEDGDHIQAVIKGSAVNQDGLTNGLTAPNGPAQQALIRQALAKAGVKPAQISYVEAHGTGTSLGDPIEVNSLKNVLMEARELNQACWIGSVKTNIGHLEAAAGIAGLIKVVLSLQNKEIPPHLHLKQLNPYIKIKNTPIQIPTSLQPWPAAADKRLAGVSSFGFGGTNAHVIVESAPVQKSQVQASELGERPWHILTLSAKCEPALLELAQRYQELLANNSSLAIADICFSANTGRSHFQHRLAVIGSDKQELAEKLDKISARGEAAGLFYRKLSNNKTPKIAFLFTGQGSQYINMGRQLYETQPVFRETLNQCCEIIETYLDKPLLKILYGDEASENVLAQTAYTQVALFAIEYALYKLWQSWGIKPSVVMGHSVGEYVAATVAGVLSLEEGLKLIAHRGRLMQQLPPGGEMLSVMASVEQINQIIAPYSEKVAIAAINGPESVVISGEAKALATVKEILDSLEIKTKQLQVSHGFHSHLMEPMLAEFKAIASEITYNQPSIPLISNITGTKADESIATPDYWVNHVRQPVKFAQSMTTLHQEGYEVFLEIGPKPILLGMGRQCLPEDVGVWLPSLRPNQDDWQQMLQSLGELYVRGVKVDWLGFDQDYHRSKVTLPTYPFQRQRYWLETSDSPSQTGADSDSEHQTTEIVHLLKDGNTQELAKQIEQAGQFSPEQVNFLPEMLEIMVQKHQKQLVSETTKDFFYQVEWKHEVVNTQTQRGIEPGHWLIFADTTGVGEKLAQQLSQRECECSLVYRSEEYQQLNESTYQLNPAEPQEFEQLIEAIEAQSKLPLRGVIHLWSLDAPKTQDLTITSLEQAQRWGCGTVLEIVKALIKTKSVAKLWLVTRGAIAVKSPSESVSVAASPLWGMGRVIALEQPQMWGGMVDLDPHQTSDTETEKLLQFLIHENQLEDHLALREDNSYVARLIKQSPTVPQGVKIHSDATYLITGGLGALGLHTARWMLEQGARHLVLCGRKQPDLEAQQTIEELQKLGAQVLVLYGDISDEVDGAKIISQIEACLPPLRGIIHGAGVLDDALLHSMNWEQFIGVMAPKVKGAWHLHNLTQNKALDFFVCFSSMASVLGSPGQGNYAAANAFMDGLAHHRRSIGLPALSINWGPWAEAGMAASLDNRHQGRMVASGITPLSLKQGLHILGQLLEQS
ncbi:MAG: type I polyketide synthase, partial [Cyanobacteria bacterium P01_C01_bin.38]